MIKLGLSHKILLISTGCLSIDSQRIILRSCTTKLRFIWQNLDNFYTISTTDSRRIILRSCMTKLGFIWQNLATQSLSHTFLKDHRKILHDKTGIYPTKYNFHRISITYISEGSSKILHDPTGICPTIS